MNDEMVVHIPLTWPIKQRQEIEERIQRAAMAEKLMLTEMGQAVSKLGVQERVLFFSRKENS